MHMTRPLLPVSGSSRVDLSPKYPDRLAYRDPRTSMIRATEKAETMSPSTRAPENKENAKRHNARHALSSVFSQVIFG